MQLHLGDCLVVLRAYPDASIDSIVTDPPYGLAFMGKRWDYDVPSVEVWAECLRVLKPGGHLLAFAGTRTQHRMAVRIEDAGFEIRDMIAWVYGSGFPKSLDVSKAIDKAAGAEREVVGVHRRHGGGSAESGSMSGPLGTASELPLTAPATPEAQQWAGWGTALKPALEPITMARKPFPSTVAANVLQHGTGALNVDGCRIKPSIAPGGREWEEQRNRAFLSAAIAALSDKLTELEHCPSIAAGPAGQTTSAKGETTPPGTCKPGTGCSDGMKEDNMSTSLSTGEFGRMPTAQSLADIASIIETASRPTIDWTTWNSCQCPSTSAITSASITAALKSLRLAASNSSNAGTAGRWPSNLIHDGSDDVVGLFPLHLGFFGETGSAARFFKQCKGYTEAWPNLLPEPANTAGNISSPSRQSVASALSDAATWALQGAICSSVSLAPSTSATGSELRQLSESVITAIQSIGPRFWRESKPAKLTLTLSHASFAVTREQTGITTITASHWKSDGSAEPVTFNIIGTSTGAGDQASVPRAFYCAKTSKRERGEGNNHPTVKPIALMQYLCRLVTPPGGTVLDPFMGSGSTGLAAAAENLQFIGIERDPAYMEIAQRRLGLAP
jgi:DNA modification methylase